MAKGMILPGTGESTDPMAEAANVSPEEQAMYDRFMDNGFRLAYSPQTRSAIVQRMKAGGDPVEGLAAATVNLVGALEESAQKSGATIPPDVLLHGGSDLLADLADYAGAAKVHTFSPEEKERALYMALDLYATRNRDRIDTQAVGNDLKMLMDADRQGRLDDLLPGASTIGKNAKGRA